MDKPSDQEGGWQDMIASLSERYASGSKTIQHVVCKEVGGSNERHLDPALVFSIENIIRFPTHDDYPFWRVRCKVTDWCLPLHRV
jgi:hypothetical protein